jgi:hypothetical protein
VTLYGLESDNPAASISIPELIVRKDQCHALIFEQNLSRDESGLLPRAEPLALYTSHYAIQGHCHMGPEAYISDFIETSRALFIGATEVSIFPLFRPRTAVIQQAPTVFIHRSAVRMHHRV